MTLCARIALFLTAIKQENYVIVKKIMRHESHLSAFCLKCRSFSLVTRASVLLIRFADIFQSRYKVIENFSRHHNTVPVRTYLLGNAHHASSGIALEINEKGFAVCNNFLRANDIVVHCRNGAGCLALSFIKAYFLP